uniref:Flagellar assembly protein FliH n=1 Tax=uncultured Campylobacterota bacterium TaxID=120858 RepID=Q2YZK5_9BACT|nr:flagellar biosynthesis/type III secretory pathway protein [uncultured Campylobacterota bacterium]
MATIIERENVSAHIIDKYNFKVLSMGNASSEVPEVRPTEALVEEKKPARQESDVDSSAMSKSSKDALIESLMKKTDEMSSNFIKLQMKLEDKEEEYKVQLQKAKETSYNEGLDAGKLKAKEEYKANYTEGLSQFAKSVAALENSAKEFDVALEGIKGELVTAAIDIAKEVINIELGNSSAEIAKVLSTELIKELQSASKVTLKVNPKDHGAISQSVGSLKHVEVLSDSAVSEGGVIAISDAGNIDAQISKRFERVKKAALSE